MSAESSSLRTAKARGFTLIELVVVMVIVSTVLTLVSMGIANIRRADLTSASGMMSGAMRYLYNLAVINNTPYRLVIDMDDRAFWGEELDTDDPCARFLPEDGAFGTEEFDPEDNESPDADSGAMGVKRPRTHRANFTKTKDNLLSRRVLPMGIVVTGVMTSKNQGPKETGKVAIHFFPGGYAENAYIWMGEQALDDDEPEVLLTLELASLNGHVTRHNEELDQASFQKEAR
jgi:prepilin-type N-terminal cleavage/methylation domain-containing protein